jgi:hypothetical protein
MVDFDVNGVPHKSAKMSGMTQLFVFKKLSPILISLMPLLGKKELNVKEDLPQFLGSFYSMPDEDTRWIVERCLELCERQTTAGSWGRIWNSDAGLMMYDDIGFVEIGKITLEVLKSNLGPFFQGLL